MVVWRASAVSFVLMMLLFSAVPGASASVDEQGVIFASEHLRLTAHFVDGAVRIVLSDGRELVLPQVVAASGAKYSDGFTTFWNKGNEAFVELDGAEYTVHVIDAATDPWEKARRAGANFRGIGQEPGWHLEIFDDRRIELTLDYGDTRITTPVAVMEIDFPHRTTTYRTLPPTSPLRLVVVVRQQACYDTMSGEGFAAAVTVALVEDEREYTGCGRWLD